MNLTSDQISGSLDRVVLVLITWGLTQAAQRGWISTSDVAALAPALVTIVAFVWGYWVNRPKAIVQSAAALPGTTVVTTPTLAAATPESNIKSSATATVVTK